MNLKTNKFHKIIEELEATKQDLKTLLEIQSERVIEFADLTKKSFVDSKYQPEVEKAFINLQEIDYLIEDRQNAIRLYSQALTSENPN